MAVARDPSMARTTLYNPLHDSRSHDIVIYTAILLSTTIFFVILRIVANAAYRRLSAVDWTVLAATIFFAVSCASVIAMTYTGFGRHMTVLSKDDLPQYLKLFYTRWSTSVIVLCLTRVTLLVYYLRILSYKLHRCACKVMMDLTLLSNAIIFLTILFSCQPVHTFWEHNMTGNCLDLKKLAYANAGAGILENVFTFGMAFPTLRMLQMNRSLKVAAGVLLSVGAFACIAAILRLYSLMAIKDSSLDTTWDYVAVIVWTEVESACGIICISLPAVYTLLYGVPSKSRAQASSAVRKEPRKSTAHSSRMSTDYTKETGHERGSSIFTAESTSPSKHHHHHQRDHRRRPYLSLFSRYWPETRAAEPQPHTSPYFDEKVEQSAAASAQQMQWENAEALLKRPKPAHTGPLDVIMELDSLGCLPDRTYSNLDISEEGGKRAWDTA